MSTHHTSKTPAHHPRLDALVHAEVRRTLIQLSSSTVERCDLIQAGHLGALEATARFDPRRGSSLLAYARPWIRGRIQESVRRAMPLPRGRYQSIQARSDDDTSASVAVQGALESAARALMGQPERDPEARTTEAESLARLQTHLAALTQSQRALITATFDLEESGDSGAGFARRAGLSRATVSRRARRALAQLKARVTCEADSILAV